MRHQALVLKSDGLPAGVISAWEWESWSVIELCRYKSFKVKLCHTPLTKLTDTFATNYGGKTPVKVLDKAPFSFGPITSVRWFGFDFDTPFEYNGRDNLVVEVWWVTVNQGGGCVQWNLPENGRCCWANDDSPGYPNRGKVYTYRYHMRITMSPAAVAPTSLGRVKSMYR